MVLRFSADSRLLICGKLVWRVDSWTKTADLVPEDAKHALGFTPEGRLYVTSRNQDDLSSRVQVRELATGALRFEHVAPKYFSRAAALSPDGTHLALAGLALGERWKQGANELRIGLWDLAAGQEEMVFAGHDNTFVTSLTFSPDGNTVVTCAGDGTVKCWDPLTGQERLTLRYHQQRPDDLAFTQDGQTLVVSWGGQPGSPARSGAVTIYRR
jgi:WD40 repeat protein